MSRPQQADSAIYDGRLRSPSGIEYKRAYYRARERARCRLAALHPDEVAALLDEELAKDGIVRHRRAGRVSPDA